MLLFILFLSTNISYFLYLIIKTIQFDPNHKHSLKFKAYIYIYIQKVTEYIGVSIHMSQLKIQKSWIETIQELISQQIQRP